MSLILGVVMVGGLRRSLDLKNLMIDMAGTSLYGLFILSVNLDMA
jgi:hypothetical protein